MSIIKMDVSDFAGPRFIDYAMSVIVDRALPYVEDGLKPVQRRIMFSMHNLGLNPSTPFKKSARIVGDVLGKYHPHGDTSVYDAQVAMAQNFTQRYPIVDGHGNYGSIDGDGAAAMRYTEARLTKYGKAMLQDLNKDVVDFVPNYDGEETEPKILGSLIPNLLCNGTMGIAVGMACSFPSHNLADVYSALIYMIDKAISGEEYTIDELINIIKAPDFATGGTLIDINAIHEGYRTGRGKVVIKSKYEIVDNKIIITELPYKVNKAKLCQSIGDLCKDKKIEGIKDIIDTSSKEGMEVIIEIKKDADVNLVLNNLLKQTQLQDNFSINLTCVVNGEPKTLTLQDLLEQFLIHSINVVTRRSKFDLNKILNRLHIIEGFIACTSTTKALDNTIKIIRESDDEKEELMKFFKVDEEQVKSILSMRLQNLSKVNIANLLKEKEELISSKDKFENILNNEDIMLNILKEEYIKLQKEFKDERRSVIDINSSAFIENEDLIKEEEIVICITQDDCIKSILLEDFKTQKRGGKGTKGNNNDSEIIKNIINISNKDILLFFTDNGRCIAVKGYLIPISNKTSRSKSIVNYVSLEDGEKIVSIMPLKNKEDKDIIFVTKKGIIKRLSTSLLSNKLRSTRVMTFRDEDRLVSALMAKESDDIIIISSKGKGIRTSLSKIRASGKNAMGVKGMTFKGDDYVVDATVVELNRFILTITSKGFGKRTSFDEFNNKGRGGKGIVAQKVTEKTGRVISTLSVSELDELIVATEKQLIRTPIHAISEGGRATQGVKIVSVGTEDKVSSIALIKDVYSEEQLKDIEILTAEEIVATKESNSEDIGAV